MPFPLVIGGLDDVSQNPSGATLNRERFDLEKAFKEVDYMYSASDHNRPLALTEEAEAEGSMADHAWDLKRHLRQELSYCHESSSIASTGVKAVQPR